MDELTIRPISEQDLYTLWTLIYKDEAPEWKKWDAPYYPHQAIPYDQFCSRKEHYINNPLMWIIEHRQQTVGVVTAYWEHEPSHWLDIGIVIYESPFWNKGIGTRALSLWVDHLFTSLPLVRLGYSTWSGNYRMIRVGKKLGFVQEACIRKARLYEGNYYDSIRMGILKEEWQAKKQSIH